MTEHLLDQVKPAFNESIQQFRRYRLALDLDEDVVLGIINRERQADRELLVLAHPETKNASSTNPQ